jgi:hypothetical protein
MKILSENEFIELVKSAQIISIGNIPYFLREDDFFVTDDIIYIDVANNEDSFGIQINRPFKIRQVKEAIEIFDADIVLFSFSIYKATVIS